MGEKVLYGLCVAWIVILGVSLAGSLGAAIEYGRLSDRVILQAEMSLAFAIPAILGVVIINRRRARRVLR